MAVQQAGAHALVLGCGGFPDCEEAIGSRLATVVYEGSIIEPSGVAVKMAEMLADRWLARSKHTYPHAPLNTFLGGDPPIQG